MQEQMLAPNEAMQLHEILTLNTLSLTKAVTMSPLVSDDVLKSLIKNNILLTQNHIKELRIFVEQATTASSSGNEQ